MGNVVQLVHVSSVIYGSHYGQDFGTHHNYDPSLPSVREAAEEYINTGKGDINEILESGKYKPSFGVLETTYLLKDLMRYGNFDIILVHLTHVLTHVCQPPSATPRAPCAMFF